MPISGIYNNRFSEGKEDEHFYERLTAKRIEDAVTETNGTTAHKSIGVVRQKITNEVLFITDPGAMEGE